jgi:hypothetical protein
MQKKRENFLFGKFLSLTKIPKLDKIKIGSID